MSWLGNFLTVAVFVGLLVLIPVLTVYGVKDKDSDNAHIAFYSSAAFVLLTFPLSIRSIVLHLQHWHIPRMQRYVVRILWMVPLYSLQSWLSLRFHLAATYIETLRDCYEAYVLVSFLYYIIEILGGEERIQVLLASAPEAAFSHPRPFRWLLAEWDTESYLRQAKNGVLQYVVVKVLSAVLVWILEAADAYEEGSFRLDRGYFWIAFTTNFSQCLALYVLVKMYLLFEPQMRAPTDFRPHYKFLCVKGVVFFTWWQGVAIAVLQSNGLIRELGSWTSDDVASGLQDYLITVEMLFFAIAHSYTFGYEEYAALAQRGGDDASTDEAVDYETSFVSQPSTMPSAASFREALWSSSVPTDMGRDFKQLAKGRGKKVKVDNNRNNQSIVLDEDKSGVGGREGGLSI
jgi:hypothetical protein